MKARAWMGAVAMATLAGAAITVAPVAAGPWPTFSLDEALDLAAVEVPDGVGVVVHTDFPAEAPLVIDGVSYHSLTLDITPEGSVVTRNAVARETASSPASDECDDPTFKPLGIKWKAERIPVLWRLDLRSIPDYLERAKTRETIRSAHRVWPQSQTMCSDDDKNELRYNYVGHTGKNPKFDHTNIVDFGPLGNGALGQNYTWYRGTEIVEVDLRLNNAYLWTNVESVNRYQVKNVTTHELGHQVGLDDLGDPHGGLTMYAVIDKGETSKVTLGFGDLKGAWAVSP
jgi:hypothetical protein